MYWHISLMEVKLFLSTTWRHMGGTEVYLHYFWTSALHRGGHHGTSPSLLPAKTAVPTGWAPGRVSTIWRSEKSDALADTSFTNEASVIVLYCSYMFRPKSKPSLRLICIEYAGKLQRNKFVVKLLNIRSFYDHLCYLLYKLQTPACPATRNTRI